jgi:hypothetical protein
MESPRISPITIIGEIVINVTIAAVFSIISTCEEPIFPPYNKYIKIIAFIPYCTKYAGECCIKIRGNIIIMETFPCSNMETIP